MKSWPSFSTLSRLSCSLFVVSLAFVAIALPVESVELPLPLTPENFESTVASGYWFVEHFSPWCPHCKAFAPMWAQIHGEYENSALHTAQVNCATNGDLCSEHGVNGYPQMDLYKDGAFVKTFKGSRDHEHLVNWIKEETDISFPDPNAELTPPPPPPPEPIPVPLPPPAPIVEESIVTEENEPELIYNPTGEVMKLTSETFKTVTQEGNVFVKFFAPWCGHCKKLAPVWIQLAREMRNKMIIAEVNCEEHKSICTNQGIDGYPMLHYYAPGGQKTEFTGSRKLEALKDWTSRVVRPTTQELDFDHLDAVIQENPVVYLFIHQPGDKRILNTLTKAARPLLGSPPIYTSTSNAFLNHISIPRTSSSSDSPYPILVALKDGDNVSPTSTLSLSSKTTLAQISSWLYDNRLPVSTELGDSTFQEIMNAKSDPLVVLTMVPSEGTEKEKMMSKMKEIGKKWRTRKDVGAFERNVVFAWMDGDRWGKWMKSMYGLTEHGGVVIADHGKLLYFDTEPSGGKITLTFNSIYASLTGVMGGKAKAKNSENTIERMARYLNAKLTSFESLITNNPKTTIFAFALLMLGIIIAIKRAVFDEPAGSDLYHHPGGKAGRLD